ncbi:unnamed protein product, partial [Pylaiella littoralis]
KQQRHQRVWRTKTTHTMFTRRSSKPTVAPSMPSFSSCVLEHHTARTREFAPAACRVVGSLYCECVGEPQPMKDFTQREERRVAARQHPGTCGVAMAGLIAAVETEDVRQTASRRQQEATFKSFRNQACYDAARALNVRGAGVQVRRNRCFE